MHLAFVIIGNVLLLSLAIAAVSFAPWVPARRKDLRRIMQLADLKPGQVFYDLGCGDGRTVFAAAEVPGVRAIGVELALPLYLVCKIRQWLTCSRARFYWRNLFKVNLADADVVYVFGMPKKLAKRFKEKVEAECRPGTRILSYVFPVEGWTPEVSDKPRQNDMVIYRYIVS